MTDDQIKALIVCLKAIKGKMYHITFNEGKKNEWSRYGMNASSTKDEDVYNKITLAFSILDLEDKQ